nr:MAG TPA: hypothetical protein [Caudoviricetes sp.]DAW95025.1 MAG TPA: hypothetical protein [Caudoviricetes sp.]
MKLEKSIVFHSLIKYGCAATLCPSMNCPTPHFAHIQQRRTLMWVRLLLCFDLPLQGKSEYKSLSGNFYIYIIPNSKLT